MSETVPVCPKCEGSLYDNRATKRNPKAPDWKCKDRTCDGVIWPPRGIPTGAVVPSLDQPITRRELLGVIEQLDAGLATELRAQWGA